MPPKLSEEELALLTEEEREGLEDDSLVDEGEDAETGAEEQAAAAAAAEAAEPAKPDPAKKPEGEPGGDDDVDDAAAKAKAAEDQAAAAAAAAEAEKKPDEPEQDRQPKKQSVLPDWQAPEDAQAKLTEISTQLDELATKFDDGEMTAAEYRQQTRVLEQQQRDIDRQLLKAEMAQEAQQDHQKRSEETWYNDTVPGFLKEYPEYQGKDLLLGALDAAVRRLQAAQPDNQFDPAILAQADAQVRAELGLAPRSKPATPAPKVERELPPSLATVPAADIDDIDGGSEFAAIDRLSGVDYENALAKMPDEMRERYLARG